MISQAGINILEQNTPEAIISFFEGIVKESIRTLPRDFFNQLENIHFEVSLWPSQDQISQLKLHPGSLLFGLYSGVPKTHRLSNYQSLPDKITIFAGPIILTSKTWNDVKTQIQKTVFHEIGHYFGLSDQQIYSASAV